MKWNQKWTALALAGVMSLSLLAACGADDAEPTPPATQAPTETVEPTDAPEETPDVTEEPTEEPSAPAVEPTEEPVEPTEKPESTPEPTPEATPEPTPEATPAPAGDVSVTDIWAAIESSAEFPSLMDVSDAVLADLYGIDVGTDLVEFVGKMPLMSAHVTEFLIAKVAAGRMDAVKDACEARAETLKGGNLYPSTVELVENYKLIANGDYLLFCIAENADQVVEIFNSYTK